MWFDALVARGGGSGSGWFGIAGRSLLWCWWGSVILRTPYQHFGPGPTSVVVATVAVVLVGVRGVAVLVEVHERRAAGDGPGPGQLARLFVTMPAVALASKPDAPGLLYRWRQHLRRESAAARDLEHHRGGRVTVTVLYKDPEGDPVPEVPRYCPGSFTVEVEGALLVSNRSHPPVLGDPTTFWSNLVADAAAGDLTVLRRSGDMCVVARVSVPTGARFAVVMSESDWDLVRAARPAPAAAAGGPAVTRGWARSP